MDEDEREERRNNNSGGGLIGLIILTALGVWGYNHFMKADTWSLMYENSLGTVVPAGDYASREECASKLEVARANPNMSRPECGSNCKAPETLNGPYVCDETFEL